MGDKHTPGPWKFEEPRPGDKSLVVAGEHREYVGSNGVICDLHYDDVTTEGAEEQRANARLISASPDLLAAHRAWAKLLGEAFMALAQGDAQSAHELIVGGGLEVAVGAGGEPYVKSAAIAAATGGDDG